MIVQTPQEEVDDEMRGPLLELYVAVSSVMFTREPVVAPTLPPGTQGTMPWAVVLIPSHEPAPSVSYAIVARGRPTPV